MRTSTALRSTRTTSLPATQLGGEHTASVPQEDPSRKANPKAKAHPWRSWMPGGLRERSPQWQEKRRG